MNQFHRGSIACASLLLSCGVAAAATAVTTSPTVGPPTTNLTVSVSGFDPGRLVDVYFDTTNTCLILANGTGAGSCTFKVSASAQPGNHWITATARGTFTGVQKTYLVRTDWSQQYGPDSRHAGFNPYENTISPKNVSLLKEAWSFKERTIPGSPVVAGGIVYVATDDGYLYAFNADTGVKISGFAKKLGKWFTSGTSPIVYGGKVYVGPTPGSDGIYRIFAFDAKTGTRVNGFPVALGNPASSGTPVIGDGRLFIGTEKGTIYGFDATTGAKLPNFPIQTASQFYGSPAYFNGVLYLAAIVGPPRMYAYDATTGTQLFTTAGAGNHGVSSPSISGNSLYVTTCSEHATPPCSISGDSTGDSVHQLDLDSGSSTWAEPYEMPIGGAGTPAIAYGRVYLVDCAANAYAIDTATGEGIWKRRFGVSNGCPSAVIANRIVYVNDGNKMKALDATTGATLHSFGLGLVNRQAPVVVNGTVYAAYYGKSVSLVAYRLDGSTASSMKIFARPSISDLKPDPKLEATKSPR